MLDGSFVPLFQSTPTPKRRVPIATKHLRLTKREYIDYKWDAIKHYFWKTERKLGTYSYVLNVILVIIILFMTKRLYVMNSCMSMILEQQELMEKLNIHEMHILRKKLERFMEREKSKCNSRIESIQLELSNKCSRKEDLVNNLSVSSKSPPKNHGVNLADINLGAKSIPHLSSPVSTSYNYPNRLSHNIYRQEILEGPRVM